MQWETSYACPGGVPSTDPADDVCSIVDPANGLTYDLSVLGSDVSVEEGKYLLSLCGGGGGKCRGVCRSGELLAGPEHRITLTSRMPTALEVLFSSDKECKEGRTWSASVLLQCGPEQSLRLLSVTEETCDLEFLWQTKLLCGEASVECKAIDSSHGFEFDLNTLFPQTWAVSACVFVFMCCVVHPYLPVHRALLLGRMEASST